MNRSIGLDIPRAIAIVMVFAAHLAEKASFLGALGVELFFALSGYLLGGVLLRELERTKVWSFAHVMNFWQRRWWRTLPNYYLFLVVFLIFTATRSKLPNVTDLIPFGFFFQKVLMVDTTFYEVSWSLCVEEWFYLLFPLTIWMLCKFKLSKAAAFYCTAITFIVVPTLVRLVVFKSADPDVTAHATFARLDAIFYGVLLASIQKRRGFTKTESLVMIFASVSILVSASLLNMRSSIHPALMLSLMPFSCALALPMFARVSALPAAFAPLSKCVANISLWSYSMYLCHIPIFFTVYSLFGDSRSNTWVNLFSKCVGVALAIGISSLLYRWFEYPITQKRPPEIDLATPGI